MAVSTACMSAQVRDAKTEGGGDVAPIPVTVRQLEALVRISESLARMELATSVTPVRALLTLTSESPRLSGRAL